MRVSATVRRQRHRDDIGFSGPTKLACRVIDSFVSVWEDAKDRGLITSEHVNGREVVRASSLAAEELLEIIMRRYERTSTLLTSNLTGGGLGQTPGRQRRGYRHARSPTSSRSCTQMRSKKLAHEN
jgi:hypothetical protein